MKVSFKFFRISRFVLLIFSLFYFNSCSLFKKGISENKVISVDENVVRKVFSGQPDWKFAEMRVTGKAVEDDDKFGFIGMIKMERNKKILIVLRSTLGFEVARLFANRDSVWIVSKMLNIKESGDWKLAAGKLGYPVDIYALQGIFMQTLFTSFGDQLGILIENLVVKDSGENIHLVSKSNIRTANKEVKYLNDFLLNNDDFSIENSRIIDVNGQWIAVVKYQFGKERVIKKIELESIDSEKNFSLELNVIKREVKESLEINFIKF